jgi:hypothetical protein
MEINPEQILRSGKHAGKQISWIMRFDRRYFDWVKENAPGMLKEHKDYQKKPSGWAPGYEKTKSPFRDSELSESYHTSPKKSYGSSWSRPQVPQREWTLEEIQARTFPEVPEGPSRYSLSNPASWGAPAGETEEED